jgi:hypothetical protein
MRSIRLLLVLAGIAFSYFAEGQYILTLHFSQMDPYINQQFEVRVTEAGSGREVGRKTIDAIQSADFSIDLYVLLQGRSYNVDFYADVNGNAAYDAPPADHAWRRVVTNATQNTVINFIPDQSYTDITFPDAFPYSTYNAIWGGKWMNLTFGSTDTIEASIDLRCDSIFGYFMTKGVFGNPAPLIFNYANARSDSTADSDTIRFSLGSPWTGDIYVVDGELHGHVTLSGFTLDFIGTVGAKQVLALYTVIVGGSTLANGYFYVRELEIQDSAPELTIELVELVNVSCAGGDNGSISVAGSGGHPVYSYLWSNGDTTATIDFVEAGTYSVTVTDLLGCDAGSEFTITEPLPVVLNATVTDVSCFGLCDGSIDLMVSGGTPFYFYLWSSGNTSPDLSGLCAGDYIVTVVDFNGCQKTLTVTIHEPDELIISNVIITNATNGQSDGSITLFASGGVGPYSYSIYGSPYVSSNVFTDLPPGEGQVCIKDANGCIVCTDFIIENITATNDLQANFDLYPNPTHSFLQMEADIPLSIDIIDVRGRIVTREGFSKTHLIKVSEFAPGIYILRLSDGKGVAYRKVMIE